MVASIQPNLSSGEAAGSPRIPDRPGSWLFVTRRFHDARIQAWASQKSFRSRDGSDDAANFNEFIRVGFINRKGNDQPKII